MRFWEEKKVWKYFVLFVKSKYELIFSPITFVVCLIKNLLKKFFYYKFQTIYRITRKEKQFFHCQIKSQNHSRFTLPFRLSGSCLMHDDSAVFNSKLFEDEKYHQFFPYRIETGKFVRFIQFLFQIWFSQCHHDYN
jgi:hypothetical protein